MGRTNDLATNNSKALVKLESQRRIIVNLSAFKLLQH
jgi:hypothetical protein